MNIDFGRLLADVSTGGLAEAYYSGKDTLMGTPPSINTKSTLTPEQQQLMQLLMGNLMPTIGTPTTDSKTGKVTWSPGGTFNQVYPGNIVPGLQGMNTDLIAKVKKMITNPSGPANADLIKSYLPNYSKGYTPEAFNPDDITNLFNATVKNPAMRDFNENILPGIAEKLAGRNSFDSGATPYEFAKAGSDLQSNLSGQLATMLETNKEAVAGRNLQGTLSTNSTNAGMIQSLLNMLTSGDENSKAQFLQLLGIGQGLGTTQQNVATAQGSEDYTKWMQSQPYNNPWLSLIMQSLGLDTQQNIVNPGTTGLLPSLIAGGSKITAASL